LRRRSPLVEIRLAERIALRCRIQSPCQSLVGAPTFGNRAAIGTSAQGVASRDRKHALKDQRHMNTSSKVINPKPAGFAKADAPRTPPNPDAAQTLRTMGEQGATQAKETFEKASATATKVSDLFTSGCASAMKNVNDYNAMLLEFARVNANHTFDFLQKLPGITSPSALAELSADHTSKQVAAWSDQARKLTKALSSRIGKPGDNATTP